jgi:hypothetical protein
VTEEPELLAEPLPPLSDLLPEWLTDRLHDLAVHGGLPRRAGYVDEYDVGLDDVPAPSAASRLADVLPFRPAEEGDYQGGWR